MSRRTCKIEGIVCNGTTHAWRVWDDEAGRQEQHEGACTARPTTRDRTPIRSLPIEARFRYRKRPATLTDPEEIERAIAQAIADVLARTRCELVEVVYPEAVVIERDDGVEESWAHLYRPDDAGQIGWRE